MPFGRVNTSFYNLQANKVRPYMMGGSPQITLDWMSLCIHTFYVCVYVFKYQLTKPDPAFPKESVCGLPPPLDVTTTPVNIWI